MINVLGDALAAGVVAHLCQQNSQKEGKNQVCYLLNDCSCHSHQGEQITKGTFVLMLFKGLFNCNGILLSVKARQSVCIDGIEFIN